MGITRKGEIMDLLVIIGIIEFLKNPKKTIRSFFKF